MKRNGRFQHCGFVLVIALLLVSAVACDQLASSPPAISAQATGTVAPAPPLSGDFSTSVRRVAQRVKPAVVQITSEQVQTDQFNRPFSVPAGVGSGVIYDSRGYVLTNNHVVEGAQKLLVSLPDGQSFDGKVVGRDPQTDLAVVQISGSNLPIAQLGDSGQLQVGDWVVAIGNALGLPGGPTVTAGVVSALGRTIQEPGGPSGGAGPFLFDVVQTDTPINPGNSGGPLVNLAGQVIGINTLVAADSGSGIQPQGIGFAIAISTAKPIADELVASGKVAHPYLGIQYMPLNPAISARLGTSQKEGVLVSRVVAGSPAAAGDLKQNDIITEIDGVRLQDESALAKRINAHKPGETVTLTVTRGSQTSKVQVRLGQLPSP